jgi:hypothetical protein
MRLRGDASRRPTLSYTQTRPEPFLQQRGSIFYLWIRQVGDRLLSQIESTLPPVSPVCRTRFAMPTEVDLVFQDRDVISGQASPGLAM